MLLMAVVSRLLNLVQHVNMLLRFADLAAFISTGDKRSEKSYRFRSLTVSAHAGSIDSSFGRAEQPYNRAPRGQPIGCRYGPW